MCRGTTASPCGTTAPLSSTTARHRNYGTQRPSSRRYKDKRTVLQSEGKVVQRNMCVCVDSTLTFPKRTALNSMAFLRLKYTEKKCREPPSSIGSEGHRIVLCLEMRYLKCSMHTINPKMYCHQSPKPHRKKYALTPSDQLTISGYLRTHMTNLPS